MAYFKIMLESDTLLGEGLIVDNVDIKGFFCTRYIEAENIELAVKKIKKTVLAELKKLKIRCADSDLIVESVERISALPDSKGSLGQGFSFYGGDD